jgi:NAD(P)-dependent dehydrogenase (short-subunit alcohol dehydrogenase family)
MGKLEGKTALITGGSSGFGLATAKRFVDEGAYVFITGRRQSELETAADQIGRNVTGVQSDASKMADLDKLYATVRENKSKLDIVFANAGTGAFAPLGQISEEHFDKQFDVNVRGLLFTVQKALPLLQPGASIVLNASIVSSTGSPAFSVYSATKAAVRSFARTWSVDLKERKIRVNAISPGVIPTPGLQHLAWDDPGTSRSACTELNWQYTPGPSRHRGRNRKGRLVPGLRRQQLRNWDRVVRRWRLGPDITGVIPGWRTRCDDDS